MVTAAQTQVEALRALKVKKFVGVTYFVNSVNDITTSYFRDAGFDVMAMEGISVAFEDVGRLASQEIYAHTRKAFLKNPGAEGDLHARHGLALPGHNSSAGRRLASAGCSPGPRASLVD